jgi:hypothetical protein
MPEFIHSPEPWKAIDRTIYDSLGSFVIADTSCSLEDSSSDCGTLTAEVTDANTARIAACVNACKGIHDPAAVLPDILNMAASAVCMLKEIGCEIDETHPELGRNAINLAFQLRHALKFTKAYEPSKNEDIPTEA